jgi:hypothetical protein
MNSDQLQAKIMSESDGHTEVSGSNEIPKTRTHFIPKLEDIRHGYECEMLLPAYDEDGEVSDYDIYEWRSIIYCLKTPQEQANDMYIDGVDDDIKNKQIRTRYLDFEQIAKEGWSPLQFESGDKRILWFEKGAYKLGYLPMMNYNLNGFLKIQQRGKDDFSFNTVYRGTCDCINQFRTIIKLL